MAHGFVKQVVNTNDDGPTGTTPYGAKPLVSGASYHESR